MNDFFDRATFLYQKGLLGEYEESYEIVERIRLVLSDGASRVRVDTKNLESVFNVIEMGEYLGGIPGASPHDMERARSAMIRLILAVLERTQRFQWEGASIESARVTGCPAYGSLVQMVVEQRKVRPRKSLAFITYNYDCGLEAALRAARLDVNYGLDGRASEEQIGVFKLHGSLNWLRDKSRSRIVPIDVMTGQSCPAWRVDPSKDGVPMRVSDLIREQAERQGLEPHPVIVPPSESKGEGRQPLASVWRAACSALSRAHAVVIAGYSIPQTDQFFSGFFSVALCSNKDLRRVYSIDPQSSANARVRGLLSGYMETLVTPYQTGFGSGIGALRKQLSDDQDLIR